MATSTRGGHVNIFQTQPPSDGRRRRRLHSDEFKATAVASCTQPATSMASVGIANGVNANLLRRWVCEPELRCGGDRPDTPVATVAPLAFVPMQLPTKCAAPEVRIELRCGAIPAGVTCPSGATAECAQGNSKIPR